RRLFRSHEARADRHVSQWSRLAGQGVLAALLPGDVGGMDGGPRTLAIIMAEIGRSSIIEPFLACAVVSGRLLSEWSDKPARAAHLGSLLRGETLYVLVHDSGADPFAAPNLIAYTTPDGVRLRGTARSVHHAHIADELLVAARDGADPEKTRV